MTIHETREGGKLVLKLAGRLDTVTAPDFEKKLAGMLPGVDELVLDLEDLDYLSSSGLRVMLYAHKAMLGHGKMVVCHPNDLVMEVFEVTGFSEILNIE